MSRTNYYMTDAFDVSSALERMDEIDDRIEELSDKGELTEEELSKLYYQKFIQGLKLNTGYVRL